MFRKPREPVVAGVPPSKPSMGRAPTPPLATGRAATLPLASKSTVMAKPQSKTKPTQARLSSFFSKATESPQPQSKTAQQQNDSILKFFKKVEAPVHYEKSLFIDDAASIKSRTKVIQGCNDVSNVHLDGDEPRFNEHDVPQKRRCTISLSEAITRELEKQNGTKIEEAQSSKEENSPLKPSNKGPFAEDSDSEGETAVDATISGPVPVEEGPLKEEESATAQEPRQENSSVKPLLKREATSFVDEDDFEMFEELDGDEFYEDGEEYLERRYMEEQAALERDFEADELDVEEATELASKSDAIASPEEAEPACPICACSFKGISSQEASVHVNNCLDGNPNPLPKKEPDLPTPPPSVPSAKRFQRAAIPRPGQANPFSLAPSTNGSSAFSKLMSSHAEDEAWVAAAANETASRGKPAFKRTCPFYKILPGFFTCVDAFRYGAVEGCNAYFLSHFHSDHYIGLTSSWCHGPIYCSRVTGNLVRQQLRVDPKWVVDLEWNQKIEVAHTQGVFVTMIPANHCPGSSLYLFEKALGKGPDPRLQRVLHCGDFRACTAHVQHPLLRPDVVDVVTGKKRQQKLNVCYLDTTYLTPKYAFPPQERVIQACADMCLSLSKDKVDELDAWERTKRARAGSGMVKFVRQGSKGDQDGTDEVIESQAKGRGRLLVVVGTYSIGKERMCLGIARALGCKIYAPASKKRICLALEDQELAERLTDDPYEAQIHMQMLMEIRPETLADYLTEYKPRFSRVVGFRPTGWNYRPPNSRFVESPLVQTVLHSDNWKTNYTMAELIPQRGSTRESNCFGVPYSEHSSFRELTMFCCALRIDKIIPTVNVGSAKSRERMKGWIEKWALEKKKNGLFRVADDAKVWD